MYGDKETTALYSAMVKLADLIENADDEAQADRLFQAIVLETDTVIAKFIWDYYVNWEIVTWKKAR